MSWQERDIAEKATEIRELGKDLHDRLAVFAGYMDGVGKGLETAIERYNKGVGSFDNRVMPKAREFLRQGITSTKQINNGRVVETNARTIKSNERITPEAPRVAIDKGETERSEAIAFEGSDSDGFRLKPNNPYSQR